MTLEEVNKVVFSIERSLWSIFRKRRVDLKTFTGHDFWLKECDYKRWDVVFNSMTNKPECVHTLRNKCPVCKTNLVSLWYVSPQWTWENLMGDAGFLIVCPNCGKQLKYKEVIMN